MNPHLDELISLVNHPAIQGRRGKWAMHDRSWCNKWKKVSDEYPALYVLLVKTQTLALIGYGSRLSATPSSRSGGCGV